MSVIRTEIWDRNARLVVAIEDGALKDRKLKRALTILDTFTLRVRAYANTGKKPLTLIVGAASVDLLRDTPTTQWVGVLPYLAIFDTMPSVRIVVTCTDAGGTDWLLDGLVAFGDADGL
jgi:hypothetical protein